MEERPARGATMTKSHLSSSIEHVLQKNACMLLFKNIAIYSVYDNDLYTQ